MRCTKCLKGRSPVLFSFSKYRRRYFSGMRPPIRFVLKCSQPVYSFDDLSRHPRHNIPASLHTDSVPACIPAGILPFYFSNPTNVPLTVQRNFVLSCAVWENHPW